MRLFPLAAVVLVIACGVSDPPAPTGGVSLPPRSGTCARGWALVSSDYASSSISVLSQDGMVLSGTILSSAAPATGTSAALSGDVVLAREAPPSSDEDPLFAIDRYPNAVVTRVSLASGAVVAQRSVATGFASNPHDLLGLGDGRAYLARYGTNPKPGRETFDGGSDLLVVDTTSLAIKSRIDLSAAGDGFPARPDRLLRAADLVIVLLGRIDGGFSSAGDGRIAAIDPATDAIAWTADLAGVANCGAFALSQDGTKLAVTCSGVFAAGPTQTDRSDVVVLDTTKRPFALSARLAIAKPLAAPLAPAIAWDEDRLVGIAYGDEKASKSDVIWASIAGGPPVVVATSTKPFVLGDVVCSACVKTCLVSDAERGTVRRFRWNGAKYDELPETKVAGAAGLPPRTFGAL